MHFYSWTWQEVMDLPLLAFWTCLKGVHRLRAQENIRWARLLMLPNTSEDARREFFEQQERAIGFVATSDERDEEGFAKLKQMAG